uniref:Uncharacterized protein n=1 Tax=Oryza meridionalis TaxID=40149 RepID=A0A0E0D9L8_9ORYZ
MPPQFPNSRVKSTAAFSSSIPAANKPSSISSQSPAKKIMSRTTSAPYLPALAAAAQAKKIARTTSSSNLAVAAPSAAKPRQPPSISKTVAAKKPDAPSAARPWPPPSNPKTVVTKKPARAASEFSEPPVAAVTRSVHPARRLTCGTAVYVRTKYVKITARCCLVIWLPARVVSSSDAYHYTVKYAADLHAMFAGRVVRVPVGHVRPAPHRAAAAGERSIW